MENGNLRIGFIGAGANTCQRHIPGFRAIPGVSCEMVCNRSFESSSRVAREFNIPRIGNDWREVVNDSNIDAVCIGTWPNLHAEATVTALEAGKHVLTEARMAMNSQEAEAMLEAHRQAPHLVAQIVPAPFSLRYDMAVKHLLHSGELGALREIRVLHYFDAYADSRKPMDWRQNVELSGNNVMTMGILYEIVQRWLGNRNPEWVEAAGAVFTPQRLWPEDNSMRAAPIPESLSIVAGYADGFGVDFQITSVAVGRSIMEACINCSNGTLVYDFAHQRLSLARLDAPKLQALTPPQEHIGQWRVEEDFIDSIREGRPVHLTSFEDGVRYMRFTDLVAQSVEQGGARVQW